VRLGFRILDSDVGDGEGHIDGAHRQFERSLEPGIRGEERPDGRRDRAMQPGNRFAGAIETGLQSLHRGGVEKTVLYIVLASEGQLHRPASQRIREDRRFAGEVRL